jgi:hypothetical protein
MARGQGPVYCLHEMLATASAAVVFHQQYFGETGLFHDPGALQEDDDESDYVYGGGEDGGDGEIGSMSYENGVMKCQRVLLWSLP